MVTEPPRHGQLSFWEEQYESQETFSWYCGWEELEPFWRELVPDKTARVLLPGVGNDEAMVGLYDAGWELLTAFDYAESGVQRALTMFGERAGRSPQEFSPLRCTRALPYTGVPVGW